MNPDLAVLYLLLRAAAVARGLIRFGDLSAQYEHETGDWVDPHYGWSLALADINRRCVGLFRDNHRPVLSAIVVNQDNMPGNGFWGIEGNNGVLITPAEPDVGAWVEMVRAVHAEQWPPEFADLPPA